MIGSYELSDRYTADTGRVFMSGIAALARIPIEQLRRDRANGRQTAALVSGYPGSPLGGFDLEMTRALKQATDLPIVHQPAVNEELGATQVMGSQLASERPDARYDGVVGIWYGKAPGLDRAADAIRHGVFCGASSKGGAIALVGDDPAAKSSTMPSSSDAALVGLHTPVLYPATVAECLELGLHGIALSRATGLWSALKIVTPIADGTGTVTLPVIDDDPIIPTHEVDDERWTPTPSAQFLGPRMVAVEQEFYEIRLELARRYGIENKLNRLTADPMDAWLGIVATGYTYTEVVEAFRRLGFANLDEVAAAGIRVLHMRMPVPFDGAQVVDFARGLEQIFVIEEKNPTLETLVRDVLYQSSLRPEVIGKFTPTGTRILPSHGRLDADAITPALRAQLEPKLADRLAPPPPKPRELIPLTVNRAPFFCSGCPHNWGTKAPEGSVVGMGTGCHGMTLLMDESRVGESIGITAMGNEGTNWVGMAPFVDTDHIFQNLGDGTYFHSAQLSVQQAVGANTNITFKLLYNDTVAMTGGQEASFRVQVPELAQIMLLHGVREVVITTEDTARYRGVKLPDGVDVLDRTELIAVQERLAKVPGVTVIIHDQACATEVRRARRRGLADTPTTRVVINHRICEGCGDCGDVSNCLSVQPVDTPLGRKTRIDQASCNLDMSCLHGDCPAFMTVEVNSDLVVANGIVAPPDIDDPQVTAHAAGLRLAGIGGTGVVTAAQMLGTAAMLSGCEVDGLDQTGLSQKAGPVISDVTITPADGARRANLLGGGQADMIVAFDLLVAASDSTLAAGLADHTMLVGSTSETPTGRQIVDPAIAGPTLDALTERLGNRGTADHTLFDAAHAAAALTGTAATANVMVIGAALQTGLVPVALDAMREAIRLNGVAIDANLAALEWGRVAVADRATFDSTVAVHGSTSPSMSQLPVPSALEARIAARFDGELAEQLRLLAGDLTDYQHERYASGWLDLVEEADGVGDDAFTTAVARYFHRVLAYKDEYEVARLMQLPDGFAEAANVAGTPDPKVTHRLHPPVLKALGIRRKLKVPNATRPAFRALAAGKRLRGTRLDPFGRDGVRVVERALIDEYRDTVYTLIDAVQGRRCTTAEATEIASLIDQVRGYEDLKLRRITEYRAEVAERLHNIS